MISLQSGMFSRDHAVPSRRVGEPARLGHEQISYLHMPISLTRGRGGGRQNGNTALPHDFASFTAVRFESSQHNLRVQNKTRAKTRSTWNKRRVHDSTRSAIQLDTIRATATPRQVLMRSAVRTFGRHGTRCLLPICELYVSLGM